MSSTESSTPSILAALSVMTAMKPSDALSRSSDPQYPARAGSNIAPSQCTIAFPETFAEDRGVGLPIGVRADGFGGEVAAGHHDGLVSPSPSIRAICSPYASMIRRRSMAPDGS